MRERFEAAQLLKQVAEGAVDLLESLFFRAFRPVKDGPSGRRDAARLLRQALRRRAHGFALGSVTICVISRGCTFTFATSACMPT